MGAAATTGRALTHSLRPKSTAFLGLATAKPVLHHIPTLQCSVRDTTILFHQLCCGGLRTASCLHVCHVNLDLHNACGMCGGDTECPIEGRSIVGIASIIHLKYALLRVSRGMPSVKRCRDDPLPSIAPHFLLILD